MFYVLCFLGPGLGPGLGPCRCAGGCFGDFAVCQWLLAGYKPGGLRVFVHLGPPVRSRVRFDARRYPSAWRLRTLAGMDAVFLRRMLGGGMLATRLVPVSTLAPRPRGYCGTLALRVLHSGGVCVPSHAVVPLCQASRLRHHPA